MVGELPVVVPGPVPPTHRDAWYAPDVSAQYQVHPGVIATIHDDGEGFEYRTREPALSDEERDAFESIREFVGETDQHRPETRDGAIEQMEAGLPSRWRTLLDRDIGLSPSGRRRVAYYVASRLRGLGTLTPLALDRRIRVADTSGERIVVHTNEFAPVRTRFQPETPFLERFLRDRVATDTVSFEGVDVPVTIFRRRLLGGGAFDTVYAITEPERFPGDYTLVEETKRRIRQSPPDGVLEDVHDAVGSRARRLLERRIGRSEDGLLGTIRRGIGRLLGGSQGQAFGRHHPDMRERIDDLTYFVLRDLIGDGPLTIPILDPRVRAIEANSPGERVTVVLRDGTVPGVSRVPTTVSIDDEERFLDLARKLAAEGGKELSTRDPFATVELTRGSGRTQQVLQCSVGLPTVADEGPFISLDSTRSTPPTPIELIRRGTLTKQSVAAVWTIAATRGVVLFHGPVESEPTLVMSAHTSFIPREDRPVGVDGVGTRVTVPHDTGLSVQRPPERTETEAGSIIPGTSERTALHPDVVILPDVTDTNGFEYLSGVLGTGLGVVAAGTVETRALLVEKSSDEGIGPRSFGGIDLVVSLPGRDRGESPRLSVPVTMDEGGLGPNRENAGDRFGNPIQWEAAFPKGSDDLSADSAFFDSLSRRTGTDPGSLLGDFERRKRYVDYLVSEGITETARFRRFLSDLRTDEPATVERIQKVLDS
ncbi:MAG: hypothetical protein ABEJ58_11100 [Halodesulfurarchaeum sp.]